MCEINPIEPACEQNARHDPPDVSDPRNDHQRHRRDPLDAPYQTGQQYADDGQHHRHRNRLEPVLPDPAIGRVEHRQEKRCPVDAPLAARTDLLKLCQIIVGMPADDPAVPVLPARRRCNRRFLLHFRCGHGLSGSAVGAEQIAVLHLMTAFFTKHTFFPLCLPVSRTALPQQTMLGLRLLPLYFIRIFL